jgi:hypothetical protein
MTYEDGANLVFGYLDYSVITTISEIEMLIASMSIAGASADTIRATLIYDLNNGGRIFGSLVNGITNGTGIGITTSSQIAQMLEYAKAGIKEYKWVAVSKNPCFNCEERAGRQEEMAYWEMIGLPRSGFSVCRGNCKCHLEPSGYSGKTTVILD